MSTLIIVVVWVLLANGVAALAVAPPPSSGFPYQDIAHFSRVVLGGASAAVWRARRWMGGEVSWSMPVTTGRLLLLAFIVQSILGLQNT